MKKRKTRKGFGALLAIAREEKGLTQQELADKVNVARSQITRFENGERRPSRTVLNNISLTLQISPEQLITKRSKVEVDARYDAYLRDYEELRKFKLDEEQMMAHHWIIKRILLELSIDGVRNAGKSTT